MESVNDRVHVKVEDTLLQLLQVAVELEMHPAGGKRHNEGIDFPVVGLILLPVLINHFECLECIGDQGKELVCFVNHFGGGLVEIFARLAPKTIQHEFDCSFTFWVLDDEAWFDIDPFSLLILIDIPSIVFGGDGPSGVAGRLSIDLRPSIHVVSRVRFCVVESARSCGS